MPEQDAHWQEVRLAADQLALARKRYDLALREAKEAGLSNAAIGRAARITEAAIRMRESRRRS